MIKRLWNLSILVIMESLTGEAGRRFWLSTSMIRHFLVLATLFFIFIFFIKRVQVQILLAWILLRLILLNDN